MHPETIVKLVSKGRQRVVDIEVDNEDHIFYGNNIATSNSHSVSYAYNSYLSAYCKANFPKEFFTSYLSYSGDKPKPLQEIYELVTNAKSMGIYVMPPSFIHLNSDFDIIEDTIYFGLSNIKNVGKSMLTKLISEVVNVENELNISRKDWLWETFLFFVSQHINKRVISSLINTGTFDCFDKSRKKMLFEYKLYDEFTNKEKVWAEKYIKTNNLNKNITLEHVLNQMIELPTGRLGACSNKNRKIKIVSLLKSMDIPPYELEDKQHQLAKLENTLLGVSLTATELDDCDKTYLANCTCDELHKGYRSANGLIILAGQINKVRETTTKRGMNPGQAMGFVEISDMSGSFNSIVVFPEQWSRYSGLLEENNRVLISGKQNVGQDSFIVDKIEQLS